jgi:hypothetical protein
MRVTSGTVMKVVTSAMITIMANVLSDITCYHRVWIQINMIIAQLKLNKRVFEGFNLFGRSFNLLRHHVNLNCCSSPGFECQFNRNVVLERPVFIPFYLMMFGQISKKCKIDERK